jgi:FAD:protein FMN transferase
MRALGLALACALALALTGSAVAAPGKVTYTGKAMGTYVKVWIWTDKQVEASKTWAKVLAEMQRLDGVMTNFNSTSEIGQINANAGIKPVKVSDETIAVIQRAIDVSNRSGGVFDITVGAFKGLWKFDEDMDAACREGKPDCQLPDPADVEKRRKLVNYKDIVVDTKAKTVFLRRKAMAITLGGIAKGYAVDKCVAILKHDGFTDFMVQAGGDMYIAGSKGEKPWVVGIRDPRGGADDMFALEPIRDHSFSTSGDYERGFVKDGVRYHHILDPRNGQPAHASRSVTIRAKDAFTADAWSKVMFIDGPTLGQDIIKREKLDDFEVVWVDDKNEVHTTAGIEADLQRLKPPTDGP